MRYFISLFCVLTKWCNNYISIQYYKQMHTCTLHFKHHVNWRVIWLVMILMHCIKFYVFVFENSQIIYKVLMSTMIAFYLNYPALPCLCIQFQSRCHSGLIYALSATLFLISIHVLFLHSLWSFVCWKSGLILKIDIKKLIYMYFNLPIIFNTWYP